MNTPPNIVLPRLPVSEGAPPLAHAAAASAQVAKRNKLIVERMLESIDESVPVENGGRRRTLADVVNAGREKLQNSTHPVPLHRRVQESYAPRPASSSPLSGVSLAAAAMGRMRR